MEQKYFAYARVSRKDYEQSIEEQINAMKNLAKNEKLDWKTQIIERKETASAKEAKRPPLHKATTSKPITLKENAGFERELFYNMLELLEQDSQNQNIKERKYLGIMVWKLDRISRNVEDFKRIENLMNKGYRIKSVTETIENTYTGKLLFRLLYSFAVYEDEKLSVRISISRINNMLKKDFAAMGGKLYIPGYKYEETTPKKKELIIDKKFKQLINDIYETFYNEYTALYNISGSDPEKAIKTALDKTKKYINSKHKATLALLQKSFSDKKDEINENISSEEDEHIKEEMENSIKNIAIYDDLIKEVLYNERSIKYNGHFSQNYTIQDDTLKKHIEEISKKDDDLTIDGEILSGQRVTLSIPVPELQIIDNMLYTKVQAILGLRTKQIRSVFDRGIFSDILYFNRDENIEQKTTTYIKQKGGKIYVNYRTTKKTVGYQKQVEKNISEQKLLSSSAVKELTKKLNTIKTSKEELSKAIAKSLLDSTSEKRRLLMLIHQNTNFLHHIGKDKEALGGLSSDEIKALNSNELEKVHHLSELYNQYKELLNNELVFLEFLQNDLPNINLNNLSEAHKTQIKSIFEAVIDKIIYNTKTNSVRIHIKPKFKKILGFKEDETIIGKI